MLIASRSALLGLLLLLSLFGAASAEGLQVQGPIPGQGVWSRQDSPERLAPGETGGGSAPLAELRNASPLPPVGYSAQLTELDNFGYTWNHIAFQGWIDTAEGDPTGVSTTVAAPPPIEIGFPFKFYENTYNYVSVARNGYLSFQWPSNNNPPVTIPNPEWPNEIIAPLWLPITAVDGYVNHVRGGEAPDRWLAVEWNRVRTSYSAQDELTFEVILHENGDIVFLILTAEVLPGMPCPVAGIEDSEGRDGLSVATYCSAVSTPYGVRINRPAPAGRVRVWPQQSGAFAYAGGDATMTLSAYNTGDLGSDTYDITQDPEGSVALFHEDGVTPLEDTDGDGRIDTGPVAQGGRIRVVARLAMPESAYVGATLSSHIGFSPSVSAGHAMTASVQGTVPAPFVHAYADWFVGSPKLMLVRPEAQATRSIFSDYANGGQMAVVEAPNHNLVYSWTRTRCFDPLCSRASDEVEFTILDPYGETVVPLTRLTDLSASPYHTSEVATAAVLQNGRIGFLSRRSQREQGTGSYNYNMYWTVVNQVGQVVVGPVNLTNNQSWGTPGELGVPSFWSPQIVAVGNDRFLMAWERQLPTQNGQILEIYYTVRSGDGAVLKPITRLAEAIPGTLEHLAPALTALQGNRVFLSWSRRQPGNDQIVFTVLNNNGGVVRPVNELSQNDSLVDWDNMDAVQLASGSVVAVWRTWGCVPGEWTSRIRVRVLDANFNPLAAPQCLFPLPGWSYEDGAASVVAADPTHAAITWEGSQITGQEQLYFAMVESSGSVTTLPSIFLTSSSPWYTGLVNGIRGYASASVTWQPPDGMDSAVTLRDPTPGIAAGEAARVVVRVKGRGRLAATGVTLTATLDPRLVYLSDTSGVTPVVSGNTVTWMLPDLRLYDIREFFLELGNAGGAAGDELRVHVAVEAEQPDLTPGDNTATIFLRIHLPFYLPLVMK